MAQNVTIQILLSAPAHSLPPGPKSDRRYIDGDIIAVHDTASYATFDGSKWSWNEPISSPRCAFIHITDVPDQFADNIQPLFGPTFDLVADDDPDNAGAFVAIMNKRRGFFTDIVKIPGPYYGQVVTNRESTIPWSVIKTAIWNKSDDRAVTDNEFGSIPLQSLRA
jgi:hypothetical protein